MLWSFASVIPLPPSFVAAPVVVTHPAMRPVASQWPRGTNPATYSPIVSMCEAGSADCARSTYGSRCFATWTTPPPFTPAKKRIPHRRSVSMRTAFPLLVSGNAVVLGFRRYASSSAVAMSAPFRNEEGLPFPGGLQNFLWCVRCVPLASRPHPRPLNEDDNDDADKEVALHRAISEPRTDRSGQVRRV